MLRRVISAIKGASIELFWVIGGDERVTQLVRNQDGICQGICDYFLLDQRDAGLAPEIEALGMTPLVAPIIMESDDDKVVLANYVLSLPELA